VYPHHDLPKATFFNVVLVEIQRGSYGGVPLP